MLRLALYSERRSVILFYFFRSMSRRIPRRPHLSGGTVPTLSEAMEYTHDGGGLDAMDTSAPILM